MKKRIYTISLLMCVALSLTARSFEAGERLYFNGKPSSASWWMDHTTDPYDSDYTRLWAYFFNGYGSRWIEAQRYNGTDNFYVELTSSDDWTNVILTRHYGWVNEPAFDANCLNKTGDINLNASTANYLQNFYYGSSKEEAYWWVIAPPPTNDPATWTLPAEDEQICTSAAGTEYVLAPKNYDYDNSKNHAWYKYASGTWTLLDGVEYRDNEGLQDFTVTLEGANSDTYYFMQAGKPSACRLIRLRLNQDCSEGASGACKITSFAGVASDANVTDQTSAINGVVAFDDKKNAGQLQIWSPGIDTMLIENDEIETPQTFRLKGFDASSSKTYTLYAKFLSDGTGECEATCMVTVHPPTVAPTTHTTTGTATDLSLTRFTEEDVVLTPDNMTSTYFQWTNSENDDKVTGMFPTDRTLAVTAPTEELDIEYVLLATNDPPEPAGNLIVNGDFEYNGAFTSSYTYWGTDINEFPTYDDGTKTEDEKSGGYTLTQDANYFYHTYNTVTPHHGTYFGLFDSKRNGVNQAAWVASTANNPNLKVEAGVSYLFSFWVANVNNFGEMNNGAQLQFQISYNGGATWNNLGDAIDLSDYKDNRWHGMSSIATPTVSSTNVQIRVINLNSSSKNRGNDFGLDDIRFEAVTASTANIAALERFPLRFLKCVINSATFAQRQPVGCGTTTADVDYTVNFIHPRGDLYIYEGTEMLAHIPHSTIGDEATSYAGVLTNRPVDNADHVLTVYFEDALVKTDAPTTYTYHAKAVPVISVVSTDWTPLPTCNTTTATMTAVIRYTNQNGTLSASVDGKPANPVTYTVESNDTKELTLVIPGVVADGKTGHTLNVNFSGSHGCTITGYAIPTAAPYMPSVTANTPEIQPYTCGAATYGVKVSASFTNGQNHDIIFKDWKTGTEQHVATTTNDGSAEYTFYYAWDAAPTAHEYNVYFEGADSCDHKISYTSPAEPKLTVTRQPITINCDETTYDLDVEIKYTNQDGTLNVEVDGVAASSYTPAFVANSATEQTLIAKVQNLPADGLDTHTLTVTFSGSTHSCTFAPETYQAPLSQVISSVSVTGVPASIECWETSYTANASILLPYNADGKNLIVHFEGRDTTIAVSGNPTVAVLPMTTVDADGQKITARYETAPASCFEPSNVFSAPTRLNCQKDTAFICEDADYLWPYNGVTYGPYATTGKHIETNPANIHDTLVIFVRTKPEITLLPIDTVYEDAATISLPFTITKGQPHHFDITVGTHQFTQNNGTSPIVITRQSDMYPGNYTAVVTVYDSLISCYSTAQVNFVIAGVPTIDVLTVTPRDAACNATAYAVDVHVVYQNPRGYLIVEDKTNNVQYTCAVPTVPTVPFNTPQTLDTVINISSMTPATLNWEAYFTGFAGKTTTSTAPVVPVIDTANISFSTLSCTDLTTTLTFDLHYTKQTGTFTYWVDAMPAQTATYSVGDDTPQTLTGLTISGIPADGNGSHRLHVSFDGTNGCSATYTLPTMPLSPVISSFTVTRAKDTILCDEDSITVSIAYTLPYKNTDTPAFVSLDFAGGDPGKTYGPFSTTNKTSDSYSGIRLAYGSGPVVFTLSYVPMPGVTACPVTYSLAMPVKTTCDKDTADICLGDTYSWHTNTYTPASVGLHKYNDDYDTLYLFVHSEPAITLSAADMICEDENEIRLPFTITAGTPNKLDVAIAGHSFSQVYDGTDTIVLTRPADVKAGTYTATVTVRDSMVACFSTAQTNFTIALPDRIYSKWTDLLFVDNSDNQFTAYRWFDEKGQEVSTGQYLYNPDGLPGTYYCCITTTDGQTLYTCPQTFEEAIPSRTLYEDQQNRSVMMYDYMGHRISGNPQNGIYIIIEEVNGEKKARKIAIYE